jgi:ABC-type multidrug transport system ATPase subunit
MLLDEPSLGLAPMVVEQIFEIIARINREQGVAMLSSVLRSPRAIEVNIAIMRTFVQLRRLMDSNRELARRIEALEGKYDEQFAVVFDAIKKLITRDADAPPRRNIGFHPGG